MYPETDIPPVTVDEDYKARLESDIPPTLDKLQERAAEKVGSELASSLRATNNLILFSDIVEEHQESVTPSDAANLLVNDIPQLRSRGVEVSDVSKEYILQGLEHLEQSLSSRDQLVEAIRSHLSGDSDSLDQAVQGLVEDRPSDERIRQVVLDVIDSNEEMVSEKGEAAKGPLMGDVMAQVDADGSRVSEILSEELSASQS
jgi:glutamyl-tRNA(Gln) amidotransferase subunit E